MKEMDEAIKRANEIRDKSNKYWKERAEERRQQRESGKAPTKCISGFCDNGDDEGDEDSFSDAHHPDGKNDYNELYETLLITGELDLPGEWD
jgi:hypothetical protein